MHSDHQSAIKGSAFTSLRASVCHSSARNYTHDRSLPWRDRLREIAARNGVPYLDLIEDVRRVPRDSVSSMFLPLQIDPGEHYAAPGHAWVAQQLHRRRLRDEGLWSGVASPPTSNAPLLRGSQRRIAHEARPRQATGQQGISDDFPPNRHRAHAREGTGGLSRRRWLI